MTNNEGAIWSGPFVSSSYFFFFRLACARSEPATDLTILLLLVRSNFEALDASFLLVAMLGSSCLSPRGDGQVF